MSKHFAFVVVPGHGHVNPTLPLVEELLGRGHRVSYATGPQLLSAVEKTGATPVELSWVVDTRTIASREITEEHLAGMMDKFLADATTCFSTLVEYFREDRPDAVCYDVMTFIGYALADKLGVPEVALLPSLASNEHFDLMAGATPPNFDLRHPKLLEVRAKMASFAAEQGLTKQPGPMAPMVATEKAGLNLVFVPRSFQIAGDTFDDTFRFIGPSMGSRARSEDWQPPADGSPVLFISLGTAFNDRPEFFAMCTKAFGGTPWHVAMAVGEAVDPATLGPIPANFDIRPYFPQPTVLSHARAFLSHTGMGSTMESLYYAVPLIAVPQMPEQGINADRAEELGLGRRLDSGTLTPQLLRDTVQEVADDPRIRANLARFSKELRASNGAAAGADALEAYLPDSA